MKFIDPNIARKNALQDRHLRAVGRLPDGSPVFSEVEISITGLCNRTCVFCPRVDPKVYPNLNEHMSLALYTKIVKDLADVNYSGRLAFCGFSEPLLHTNIFELLRATRQFLPDCWLEVVTNGDKLSSQNMHELFDAGLTTLVVSMYDGPEQIPYFEFMVEQSQVPGEQVILRKRYLPPEQSFGINLTNRAGTVIIKEAGIGPMRDPMQHPCFYTHYRMMVDHNGDVLLCPHDWGKKLIVGNLGNEHIVEVWTGSVLTQVRQRLGGGDRKFAPCNVCDVVGTMQGGEHFKAWQELYGRAATNP